MPIEEVSVRQQTTMTLKPSFGTSSGKKKSILNIIFKICLSLLFM